jgi:hypothetical protein
MEQAVSKSRKKMDWGASELAELSKNARIRLANNDRWAGTSIRIRSKIDI